MRAIVKTLPEPGALYDQSHPEPAVAPGYVKIEVAAASICGTDRELYEYAPMAREFNLAIPVILGHECAGTVIEVGEGVDSLSVGDQVALESHWACWNCYHCRNGAAHNCLNMQVLGIHVNGAFSERMVAPANSCFKLPAGFPLEEAALLEPAGVAMHAIQRAQVDIAGSNVLIGGGGPVGLLIAALALVKGAARVLVVEPNEYRRGLAEQLGAKTLHPKDDIVAVCRDLSGEAEGFDVAFEASGVPVALPPLLDALRREGTIIAVGIPGTPVELDISAYLIKKGLTFKGAFGRKLWESWEEVSNLVVDGRLNLARMITHRLPLSELDKAIELLSQDACKVLLLPGLSDATGEVAASAN